MISRCGVLLAGGSSSRFGSDKFFYQVDGVSMGVRAARLLQQVCAGEVWLQGGRSEHSDVTGLAIRRGLREANGPLGALADALTDAAQSRSCEVLVTLPCDVPYMNNDDLEHLVESVEDDDDLAVACSVEANGEVLHHWLIAAWRPRVASVVTASFDQGVRAIHEIASSVRLRPVFFNSQTVFNLNERTQ